MVMVKVTVFDCPHCCKRIPSGLHRSDQGLVTCPGCSSPVRITSSEYEDAQQQRIFYVCWTITAILLFLICSISSYADKHEFWSAVGLGVVISAVLTYAVGGLIGYVIVKLFSRTFAE
jgi:hypothetical protein